MTTEPFDAVLAEMRKIAETDGCATDWRLRDFADRLQAAHERAKACWVQRLADEGGAMLAWQGRAEIEQARADRAVGLLRECEDAVFGKELWERIRAFLSEQAGERESATKESTHED